MQRAIVFLLLALLLLSACSDEITEADWKTFESAAGRFSVEFPGEPKEEVQSEQTLVGPVEMHTFLVERRDAGYFVAFADYPAEFVSSTDPQLMLDGSVDGAVLNVDGELLQEKDVTVNGYPGREIEFEAESDGQQVIVQGGLFIVNNRLYMYQVISKKEKIASTYANRFMDSFQLKP